MEINKIYTGNCNDHLRDMPPGLFKCCVTSPPYYGLRDYGNVDQIGLEETPELYVQKLVAVFREVRRVMKDDGTLWLNLGDSYSGSGNGSCDYRPDGTSISANSNKYGKHKPKSNLKPKDLIGIPWMVAFALRADGWYLRQDIIWSKPNPMPESVTDRCTKAHEYIFLLSKLAKYYYDAEAIKTPIAKESIARLAQNIKDQKGSDRVPGKTNGNMKAVAARLTFGGKKGREYNPEPSDPNFRNGSEQWGREYIPTLDANKKSVWTVTTKPFSEAHFATFPEDLIKPCILAGCPEGGVVYDPFMGAGTTALVAHKLHRNFIGSELNPDYVKIANDRLEPYLTQYKMF